MRLLFSLLLASSLLAHAREFPSLHDAKRIHGELVGVDYILRRGEFRADDGKLMPFSMPPYAIMKYHGVESDLREVPLGTKMTFLMLPDAAGKPTRLITTDDGQPADAVIGGGRHGFGSGGHGHSRQTKRDSPSLTLFAAQ